MIGASGLIFCMISVAVLSSELFTILVTGANVVYVKRYSRPPTTMLTSLGNVDICSSNSDGTVDTTPIR